MFGTTGTHNLRNVLIGAAIVVAAAIGFAAPAEAISTVTASGTPGYTVTYTPQLRVTESSTVISYNPYTAVSERVFTTNGFIAYRSSASTGNQLVSSVYVLQKYNYNTRTWASWKQSSTMSGTIVGNGTLRFGSWSTLPAQSPGLYRMVFVVTWDDTAGRPLGSEFVITNQAGENVCATRLLGCTPYTDGVVVK